MSPTRVAIAGSTGSIGTQTLEVIDAENSRVAGSYEVVALAVGSSAAAVIEQARRVTPARRGCRPRSAPRGRRGAAGCRCRRCVGRRGRSADVVVNGVVGFAGLAVTIEALRGGKRLALANKESLIAAGPVVQPLRAVPGAELIPVDSEHCALHQCLRSSVAADREVARLCSRRAVDRSGAVPPTSWPA
jgi:1-deoxy-D-xylulose-5-phosphate reductoisomerase